MSAPLSKRRRTSPVTATAVGTISESRRSARPSTTSRASYRSPTKASLSRSHPSILTRSPGERRTQAHRQLTDPTRVRHPTSEPELPLTPTQLGLSPKPDKPRGLSLSSSPTGHGSRPSRSVNPYREISSPLRPRAKALETRLTETRGGKSTSNHDHEAAGYESQIARSGSCLSEEMDDMMKTPTVLDTKPKVRDDLMTQLEKLQAEIIKLESILAHQETEPELDSETLGLIYRSSTATEVPTAFPDVAIDNPVALVVNPLAFLRAFAPADLRLTSSTKTFQFSMKLHQSHALRFSAPLPWPAHVFNASFKLTCDVEERRVVALTDSKVQPRYGPGIKEVKGWMLNRLGNSLHSIDVGTICWGMGMWWKESVNRAQYLHYVTTTKAGTKVKGGASYKAKQAIEASDVHALLPFLGKSVVELIPAEPYSNRASTNEARKYRQPRLLLKWDLEIDWAGEVHSKITIAGMMVSAQGHECLKQSFEELMRKKGLDPAVNHMLEICGGHGVDHRRKIR